MFKSATFKLTMWYLAIVMAISIIFSVALYNVTTSELNRGLSSESNSLYEKFPVFLGDPHFNFKVEPYYESSAHRLLINLFLFNILILIIAGYLSYWLAKKTLTPIELAHNRQKRFTADVSHELRTPLTAIKMESEVALLDPKISDKELKNTIGSNLEEVVKLENLINNLLRLTKLEADELTQSFKSAKCQEIVNLAVDQVTKLAQTHKIDIVKDIKAKNQINIDPDSWVQLLVILLDNAIKYSPKKSKVLIKTYRKNEDMIFQIIDEGKGIKKEDLDQVFERFYRSESSRNKSQDDGFGLGLSIAKLIADLHNATITLTSRVNHGTTATIRLPIK
ncbi:MAG TPA: HAMP domain-containing sensor histidine kinase [Patescibacteria group bacterium]|nr:HAMP domain-containing sensor histidine kinase [Patescibacteria group bacterium]